MTDFGPGPGWIGPPDEPLPERDAFNTPGDVPWPANVPQGTLQKIRDLGERVSFQIARDRAEVRVAAGDCCLARIWRDDAGDEERWRAAYLLAGRPEPIYLAGDCRFEIFERTLTEFLEQPQLIELIEVIEAGPTDAG